MQNKLALVTDFDGTISGDDFFDLIVNKYLTPDALEPWHLYLQGKMTHIEALGRVFAQIRIPEKELLAFIDRIPVDGAFFDTARYCKERKIPLYICSAGCDYYIKRILGDALEKYDICLVTNHGEYSPADGLKLIPPRNSPFYDKDVGISKAEVVRFLQERGYKTVLCGDGPPDVAPARIADAVFAKKFLLKKCREANIITQPFNTFGDVLSYLKEV